MMIGFIFLAIPTGLAAGAISLVIGAQFWLALMIYVGAGAAVLFAAVFLTMAMSPRLPMRADKPAAKYAPTSR